MIYSQQFSYITYSSVNYIYIYIYLKFIYLFIYLFLAVLGLRFCARAFSSCGKRGPLFIALRGPLTIMASLVAEHRLQTHRLSSCGSRAQLLRGMWDLPRPGHEPVSPALTGRFLTTAPPGKPPDSSVNYICHVVHYISSTYLPYNWKFVVPFECFHPIPPSLPLPDSGNHKSDLFFCEFVACLFVFEV